MLDFIKIQNQLKWLREQIECIKDNSCMCSHETDVLLSPGGVLTVIFTDGSMHSVQLPDSEVDGNTYTQSALYNQDTGLVTFTRNDGSIYTLSLAYLKAQVDLNVTNINTLDNDLNNHLTDFNNPHQVTKEQVGLGNVDNTSDLDKPISTDTQDALTIINNNITNNSNAITDLDTSTVKIGDNITSLVNDAGYITIGDVPPAPVLTVSGKVGNVLLYKADILDLNEADYATAAQGLLADSALQNGDNISELNNDVGYITLGEVPIPPVDSVNSQTGVVVLDADDIDDTTTIHKFITASGLTQIDTNTTDISDLQNDKANQSDLDITNQNVSNNTTDISNLQSDLDTTNTNVSNNTNNISTNTTNISNLQTDKADQSDLDITNTNVSTNTANISTNTTNINNLQNDKVNISDIVDNVSSTDIDKPLSANQGKVLNDKIIAMEGSLIPQGNWDALTNTPDITSTTTNGFFWIVSVDGATNLGGITDWKVNDWAVYTDNGWAKVDNTDKVTSVNGVTGDVELDGADIETTAGSGVTILDNFDNYYPLTGGVLNGALTSNRGNGYSSSFSDNGIFSSKDGRTSFSLSTLGGYFSWFVNGETSNPKMELASNGQLTLTEQLNANGGIRKRNTGNTGFDLTDTEISLNGSSVGGWARVHSFKDYNTGNSYGGFGGHGNAGVLNSWFIGKAYNDNTFKINYATGQLTLTEQLNANNGIVTPSVTNNGIKSTRYSYTATAQNYSASNLITYPLSNFGFSGDWKDLSIISVLVFNNADTISISASGGLYSCSLSITSGGVSIGSINGTPFYSNANYTTHTVKIIIEENI